MANRRMFSLDVVDTDKFLDMSASAQALYFHLGMRADDDGFVSSPRKIAKVSNCGIDDLTLLAAKGFIITFESGVVVVKHWRENNYIRTDRYKPTRYTEEAKMLEKVGDVYQLSTNGIPTDNQMVDTWDTQDRLGKDSIGKDSINNKGGKSSRFIPPTVEEVRKYCLERGNNVDAQCFVDFYSSKGWYVGKSKMKDWKASVRTWEKRRQADNNNMQTENRNLEEWLNA